MIRKSQPGAKSTLACLLLTATVLVACSGPITQEGRTTTSDKLDNGQATVTIPASSANHGETAETSQPNDLAAIVQESQTPTSLPTETPTPLMQNIINTPFPSSTSTVSPATAVTNEPPIETAIETSTPVSIEATSTSTVEAPVVVEPTIDQPQSHISPWYQRPEQGVAQAFAQENNPAAHPDRLARLIENAFIIRGVYHLDISELGHYSRSPDLFDEWLLWFVGSGPKPEWLTTDETHRREQVRIALSDPTSDIAIAIAETELSAYAISVDYAMYVWWEMAIGPLIRYATSPGRSMTMETEFMDLVEEYRYVHMVVADAPLDFAGFLRYVGYVDKWLQ